MKTSVGKLALLCCVLIMSCASNIKTKRINDQNPFDYRTYAYLPETGLSASEFNRERIPTVDEPAIQKMKERMNKMGFAMNKSNPDLVVLISDSNTIKSNLKKDGTNRAAPQTTSGSMNPYSGATTASSNKRYTSTNSTPTTRPFQNGNMIIELFNYDTKELIWVGTAKNFKSDIAGQNLSTMMVDAIFNDFR